MICRFADWQNKQVCNRYFSQTIFAERTFGFRYPVHESVLSVVVALQHVLHG